jgi:hypothetical protein
LRKAVPIPPDAPVINMRGISSLVFAVRKEYGAAMFAPQDVRPRRHCEERCDEAIQLAILTLDCFAEPVIGRAFA